MRTVPDGENNKPKGCGIGSRSALIVPAKAGNRGHRDPPEGSGAPHDRNQWRETREDAELRKLVSETRLDSRAAAACPDMVFTTLHHHIDLEWMLCAWSHTRKDGAAGIDGAAAADYEESLESSLLDLMGRIKSGSHYAPPVRRAWIPKADGAQRPLGIPTLEDKVAQRAVLMLLEPICEREFLACSYGFRPERSAHMALSALRDGLALERLHWVIDADISKYFDSIDRGRLRAALDLRVEDGAVRRMIDKWLAAGVLDEGVLRRTGTGTPQGGVMAPFTQEATSASSERYRTGGTGRCLTCAVKGNRYMTHDPIHATREGRAPQRRLRIARAGRRGRRRCATALAAVRNVPAPILPLHS